MHYRSQAFSAKFVHFTPLLHKVPRETLVSPCRYAKFCGKNFSIKPTAPSESHLEFPEALLIHGQTGQDSKMKAVACYVGLRCWTSLV